MSRCRVLLAVALASGTALTGCTTMGGNIKGSFACSAPEGVCAPSSTIDDRALAMISGDAGDTMIQPAGPVQAPRTEGRGFQTAALTNPARTHERVLRIVFPAQIDAAGRLHEQTAVHAVVEQGDWQQAAAATQLATTSADVVAATGGDTILAALERADPPATDAAQGEDPDMPSAAAVEAARARGATQASGDPVGDIKDQVARRLWAKPRRTAAVYTAPRAVAATASRPPLPARPAGQQFAVATPARSPALSPQTGASAPTSTPTTSAQPRIAYPTVPAGAPATILPARVTPAGRAAVAAVGANPAIRAGLASAQPAAREATKANDPTAVVRAAAFPGVNQ